MDAVKTMGTSGSESGRIVLDEEHASGARISIILSYAVDWETQIPVANSIQFKASTTQGSVRLKLGGEVQIIRAGTRAARPIKKLEVDKPK